MNITAPVTDYVRASLLTTAGDMLRRGPINLERVARPGFLGYLGGYNGDASPVYRDLTGIDGSYYVSQGVGVWPIWETLKLRDTGVHIANSMRNAGGDQVITGVGFECSIIIFIVSDNTPANLHWSIGFTNGTADMVLMHSASVPETRRDTSYCMYIQRGGGNELKAVVNTIGADGFTITWTLAGACAADFIYLCLP